MTSIDELSTHLGDNSEAAEKPPRLRVRQDLLFTETPEGVLVRWGSTGFVLKGATAYGWLAAVLPHLDGTNTIDDIIVGLTEDRARTVRQVVESLVAREAVRPMTGDDTELSAADREAFADQLGYIAHYTDDSGSTLAALRTTRVSVIGSGDVAESVVAGLLANGFGNVGCDPAVPDTALVSGELQALRARGVSIDLGPVSDDAAVTVIADPGATGAAIAGHVAAAVRGGSLAVPVVFTGSNAVVGPVCGDDRTLTWDDAMTRYMAAAERAESHGYWRARSTGRPVPSAATSVLAGSLLGNLVAFEVFKLVTGARPAESDGGLVIVDLQTLVSSTESPLPLPVAIGSAGPDPQPDAATSAPTNGTVMLPALEEASDAWRAPLATGWEKLMGPRSGLLPDFDDLVVVQSPVKIGRVLMANPRADDGPRSVAGWSLETLADAREHAARQALAEYCNSVAADLLPAGPVTMAGLGPATAIDVDLDIVLGSGLSLDYIAGRAAGHGAGEATLRALFAALSRRSIIGWADRTVDSWRFDPATLDDERVEFLTRALAVAGLEIACFATAHGGPLVSVAVTGVRRDDEHRADVVAVGTGTSLVDAAVEALAEVIARAQAAADDADGRPLPPSDAVPFPISADALAWVSDQPTGSPPADLGDAAVISTLDEIVEVLAAEGTSCHRLDLTTSDVASATDVAVVTVLLSRPGTRPAPAAPTGRS